eukprot:ctg_3581.g637
MPRESPSNRAGRPARRQPLVAAPAVAVLRCWADACAGDSAGAPPLPRQAPHSGRAVHRRRRLIGRRGAHSPRRYHRRCGARPGATAAPPRKSVGPTGPGLPAARTCETSPRIGRRRSQRHPRNSRVGRRWARCAVSRCHGVHRLRPLWFAVKAVQRNSVPDVAECGARTTDSLFGAGYDRRARRTRSVTARWC